MFEIRLLLFIEIKKGSTKVNYLEMVQNESKTEFLKGQFTL
jgi:hypothetical protein